MSRRYLRIALAQMRVIGGNLAANLHRAAECIAAAADQGANLIVLPEALDVGWTDPAASAGAQAIPDGATCRHLREAARRHRIHVCAGLTERAGKSIFNAAVLLGPDGELLLHHRKLNELAIGHDSYAQGDRLGVAHTDFGTVGLMICADAFARGEVISRTLGLMGADLIVSPCAWAVPAEHDPAIEPYGQLWRDCYGPVARDFRLWIAGVSSVGPIRGGPWAGRKCIGCSLLVGPDGTVRQEGPYGEEAEALLLADLELPARPARGDEWANCWNRPADQPSAGDSTPTGSV